MGCRLCIPRSEVKGDAIQLHRTLEAVSVDMHNDHECSRAKIENGNSNSPSVNLLTDKSAQVDGSETTAAHTDSSEKGINPMSSVITDKRRSSSLSSCKPGHKFSLQSSHTDRETALFVEMFHADDLISVHDMYNMLNDGSMKPYILDPFNILVLDARSDVDFMKHHIVTSRKLAEVSENSDLSMCLSNFGMIVLYGQRLVVNPESRKMFAIQRTLKESVACDVLVLSDGYDLFRTFYPFLCTDKQVITTWDRHLLTTYPSVVLESCLYQGRGDQATNKAIVDALHITHIVNISLEHKNAFHGKIKYLSLPLDDLPSTDLSKHFPEVCDFISSAIRKRGKVLVHCNLGVSRSSACVLAFLIQSRQWTLEHAYSILKARRSCVNPNVGFIKQLLSWEEKVLGRRITNVDLL